MGGSGAIASFLPPGRTAARLPHRLADARAADGFVRDGPGDGAVRLVGRVLCRRIHRRDRALLRRPSAAPDPKADARGGGARGRKARERQQQMDPQQENAGRGRTGAVRDRTESARARDSRRVGLAGRSARRAGLLRDLGHAGEHHLGTLCGGLSALPDLGLCLDFHRFRRRTLGGVLRGREVARRRREGSSHPACRRSCAGDGGTKSARRVDARLYAQNGLGQRIFRCDVPRTDRRSGRDSDRMRARRSAGTLFGDFPQKRRLSDGGQDPGWGFRHRCRDVYGRGARDAVPGRRRADPRRTDLLRHLLRRLELRRDAAAFPASLSVRVGEPASDPAARRV